MCLSGISPSPLAPDQAGEPRRHVLLEAHRLADLADRHARAIVDDGGADGGALAAVAAIEILDHLLAPLVLEVDVDVGRLAPVGGDEALEQQVDLGGIDRGDAEAEAHRAVGGRAAALAQDRLLLRAGEADDVVDGEEVAGVVEPGDQRQLLDEERAHLVRHAVGIVPGGVRPGQLLQVSLRGLARRHRLVGVFVAQLLQIEADALRRSPASARRPGDSCANRRAISRAALQMPLGVGLEAIAGLRNRALLADAGEHVGERLAAGVVVMGIVGGNERRARPLAELIQLAEAPTLVPS